MGTEVIAPSAVNDEEIVSDQDVLRMVCIAMIGAEGTLDQETLEGILESTNRRGILDGAQAFVDAGGLEEDDEDEDADEDDEDDPEEENDEDDEDEDEDEEDDEGGDES